MEGQHRAYCRRHAELLRMMQEMELGMRRLEADPKDWERFGLGKLNPLPPFLRAYCRAKLREDEASSSRGP